jgi:ADP-heptose:LPS heptosyltransferase
MRRNVLQNGAEPIRRIALINPTKFLGNLLLAGQFIQHLSIWCEKNNFALLLVLDQQFKSLIESVPLAKSTRLVFYPRSVLRNTTTLSTMQLWLGCVRSIREFRADLAFHLEEDSVSIRLTRLSGAQQRVSSASTRSRFGFDDRLSVERVQRRAEQRSIWYVFREIFEGLQLPVPVSAAYIDLGTKLIRNAEILPSTLATVLADSRPKIVMHAGASKRYKKWPVSQFADLCRTLLSDGFIVFLVGHGADDRQINLRIKEQLADTPDCHDLNGQLDLPMLAALIAHCQLMVGNDSGPSHLGSALGVPGVVIFGPTEIEIWRPLGEHTRVLSKKMLCRPDCSRHHCEIDYACLRGISAHEAYTELMNLYGDRQLQSVAKE